MLNLLQKAIIISLILIVGYASVILADQNLMPISRYLAVPTIPLTSQTDLLKQIFQVRFPSSVKTNGDAMRYLLRFSGYALISENNSTTEIRQLLTLPLPQANRLLGPLSLEQGLLTLAGQPFGLLVDPVHRLISFRVLPAYQSIYQKPTRFFFF